MIGSCCRGERSWPGHALRETAALSRCEAAEGLGGHSACSSHCRRGSWRAVKQTFYSGLWQEINDYKCSKLVTADRVYVEASPDAASFGDVCFQQLIRCSCACHCAVSGIDLKWDQPHKNYTSHMAPILLFWHHKKLRFFSCPFFAVPFPPSKIFLWTSSAVNSLSLRPTCVCVGSASRAIRFDSPRISFEGKHSFVPSVFTFFSISFSFAHKPENG